MSQWADIRARWSAGWTSLYDEAVVRYEQAVRANPQSFAAQVTLTLRELELTRSALDRMSAHLRHPEASDRDRGNWAALNARYQVLAAGIYADARPVEDELSAAPAVVGVLVVAGLVLGIAAIIWAIASYEYAVNLREQTLLAERELSERVRASEDGRVLQPSTLPPPPPPPGTSPTWAVAAVVVAAGAGALLWARRGA